MNSRASTRTRFSVLPIFIALILNVVVGPLASIVGAVPNDAAQAVPTPGVTAVLQFKNDGSLDTSECNGVRTTPGSQNTRKILDPNDPGDLRPGGTANFIFSFPANELVDRGGATFEVTDCVFINGEAVLKYIIQAPNNPADDQITFTVGLAIPADAPIGAEYCNFARSEETPSDPQASNRKAGPACFIIGGALRVTKVGPTGAPLAGATFTVACTFPTTTSTLTNTIISAPAGTTGAGGVVSPDGTDADATLDSSESYVSVQSTTLNATVVTGSAGTIEVQAPVGTSCTFTETAAPANFLLPELPADRTCTKIVTLGSQQTCTFVNRVIAPDPSVLKEAVLSPIVAGDSAGFTITVSGGGTGSATDVELSDNVPDGHTWTVTGDIAGCTDPTPLTPGIVLTSGQNLFCDFGTMASTDSRVITITTTSIAADCPTISNTATITATGDVSTANNTSTATISVLCPNVSVTKSASTLTVQAPGSLTYTITGTNTGSGEARGVVITDNLDDDLVITSATFNVDPSTGGETTCTWTTTGDKNQVTCNIGTLAASDGNTDGAEPDAVRVTINVTVPTAACPSVPNRASIASSNEPASATSNNQSDPVVVAVNCPDVSVDKSVSSPIVVLGSSATFTITASGGTRGTTSDVTLTDTVPTGFTWTVGGANIGSCRVGTTVLANGSTVTGGQTIACNFGPLGANQTRVITVTATPAAASCAAAITNTAVVAADGDTDTTNNSDTALFTVRCPTLVVDKVASTETITISGPADALVATPSVVTWTLSYTLTNGPVTGAVITDPVPTGFVFLDASPGGTFAGGIITWNLGTLTTSGSVTFRTTVNPATISRTGPTVNTATIDSNETAPDTGQDSVTVVVVPPVLAGNPPPPPAPAPVLPNTATGFGLDGKPITVPLELLAVFLIGSLGALTLANVKARSRRR